MRLKSALAVTFLTSLTVAAAAPGAPAPTPAVDAVIASAPVAAALPAAPVATVQALPPAPTPAPSGITATAATLDPGEFVWRPELSTNGNVEIVVSIPLQVAYVYRGGELIGVTTVSTGRRGHETPTGEFPVLEKRREHYSNLYNNAPMPFMQRLTWGGVALHAGHIPGTPASHGCVRLPLEFARLLFTATRVGTTVHIVDDAPSPEFALAIVRGEPIRGEVVTIAMAGELR
jgi:lipoprotein-anchoring transpeptidase ErfK/SrfK